MTTQDQLLESPSLVARTAAPARRREYYVLVFFFLLEALLVIHLRLLALPFFWDEHGQFIPTALDLLRSGSWIAHSTTPNVHPPGVEAYLALWYKLVGFSIPVTRVAMLALSGLGLLVTFLLTLELSGRNRETPAFLATLFLLASPLFYTQSMMAELDMPAMLFTLLAVLLFLRKQYAAASAATLALVLVKETGLVVPLVLCITLLLRRDWKRAAYFVAPGAALLAWLIFLHSSTGYWLGNPGFAHYNVTYALHPARVALSFARHIYYLFFAEFRWIGTLVLLWAIRRTKVFRAEGWRVVIAVTAANTLLVTVLGGAELERYLLPVLPFFYIAVAIALTHVRRPAPRAMAAAGLMVGLLLNLFWNPPYPFPFENNYAMVDFVRLQQLAASFVERNLPNHTIATAWPYTAALETPEYGFVEHTLKVVEAKDFHFSSVRALPAKNYDVLITYTRTWAPKRGVIAIPMVRQFLTRFYEFEPQISPAQCSLLGLTKVKSWTRRGQEITIYARPGVAIPAGTSAL